MSYDIFDTVGMRSIAKSIEEEMSRYENALESIKKILDYMDAYFSDPTSKEYIRKLNRLLSEMERERKIVRGCSEKLKSSAGIVERRVNGIKL